MQYVSQYAAIIYKLKSYLLMTYFRASVQNGYESRTFSTEIAWGGGGGSMEETYFT